MINNGETNNITSNSGNFPCVSLKIGLKATQRPLETVRVFDYTGGNRAEVSNDDSGVVK